MKLFVTEELRLFFIHIMCK